MNRSLQALRDECAYTLIRTQQPFAYSSRRAQVVQPTITSRLVVVSTPFEHECCFMNLSMRTCGILGVMRSSAADSTTVRESSPRPLDPLSIQRLRTSPRRVAVQSCWRYIVPSTCMLNFMAQNSCSKGVLTTTSLL